jgi:hypothetical protein
MAWLWVTMLGLYATWLGYTLSVEKGQHRRKKRGLLDFGMTKVRRDAEEEYRELSQLFWGSKSRDQGVRGWTGARRRHGSSLLA